MYWLLILTAYWSQFWGLHSRLNKITSLMANLSYLFCYIYWEEIGRYNDWVLTTFKLHVQWGHYMYEHVWQFQSTTIQSIFSPPIGFYPLWLPQSHHVLLFCSACSQAIFFSIIAVLNLSCVFLVDACSELKLLQDLIEK